MFTDFCGGSMSIFHEIKNIVVEPEAGKVATEQSYIGELVDGTKNDMHNCNFFDVDAEGSSTGSSSGWPERTRSSSSAFGERARHGERGGGRRVRSRSVPRAYAPACSR